MDKNKKIPNKKTNFVISSIVVLCVAILTGTYFLLKEHDTDFIPASTEESTGSDTWEEKTDTETPLLETGSSETTQIEGDVSDQTQTIVQEDETGNTANLSDNKTKEDAASEKPQEKPVTTDDTTNPDKQPEYDSTAPTPDVPDTPAEPPAPSDSGNTNNSGKVYDPVFGWIDPGITQQDNVDSDGDINKQIGTMGGD